MLCLTSACAAAALAFAAAALACAALAALADCYFLLNSFCVCLVIISNYV